MINIKIGIRFHPSRHSFLSSTPQREDPKQLGGMGVFLLEKGVSGNSQWEGGEEVIAGIVVREKKEKRRRRKTLIKG